MVFGARMSRIRKQAANVALDRPANFALVFRCDDRTGDPGRRHAGGRVRRGHRRGRRRAKPERCRHRPATPWPRFLLLATLATHPDVAGEAFGANLAAGMMAGFGHADFSSLTGILSRTSRTSAQVCGRPARRIARRCSLKHPTRWTACFIVSGDNADCRQRETIVRCASW
jgi:hypothetical protein